HFGEIDRTISVCDGVEAKALAVYPIKVTGDVVGAIAVLERDSEQPPLDMGEQRLVSVCATLLARQIEG
ncbi:MAG: stage V sporulation T C-terminal domain-containing protein, partial [Oscillospiraceae bacterium]